MGLNTPNRLKQTFRLQTGLNSFKHLFMPPSPKPNKRGALHKEGSVFIAAWVPAEIAEILDREVQNQDSDRSKIIRRALRHHLKPN